MVFLRAAENWDPTHHSLYLTGKKTMWYFVEKESHHFLKTPQYRLLHSLISEQLHLAWTRKSADFRAGPALCLPQQDSWIDQIRLFTADIREQLSFRCLVVTEWMLSLQMKSGARKHESYSCIMDYNWGHTQYLQYLILVSSCVVYKVLRKMK